MFSAIFDLDNPVFRFLSRLVDLVVLNVIFLISCIPIFTIGTALTSLYYVCINDWDPQNAHILQKYTKSFKENFKKSTKIWFIMLLAGVIVGTDLWYVLTQWQNTGNDNYRIGIILCIICLILYLCIFTYVWPLQAKFENKILRTIQNALGMAVAHLPETVIAWCIAGIAGYLVVQYTIMLAVFLILLCSTVAYIQSSLFRNVLRPYLGLEEEARVAEEAQADDNGQTEEDVQVDAEAEDTGEEELS